MTSDLHIQGHSEALDSDKMSSSSSAALLLDELAALRIQLAKKDALLAQQAEEIQQLTSKQKEVENHAQKLEAAVSHRDAVISQLASSRKLVFEECHRACTNNQTELRQMQDALHRVSRQLQRERREHAARIKELRRSTKRSSTSSLGGLTQAIQEEPFPWDVDHVLSPTGLCLDEGVDDIAPAPGTPGRSSVSKSSMLCGSPPSVADRALSPETGEEVDFLTW